MIISEDFFYNMPSNFRGTANLYKIKAITPHLRVRVGDMLTTKQCCSSCSYDTTTNKKKTYQKHRSQISTHEVLLHTTLKATTPHLLVREGAMLPTKQCCSSRSYDTTTNKKPHQKHCSQISKTEVLFHTTVFELHYK